jgi:hypothetical protein
MATQVVDFGEQCDSVDEFVCHPDGYEGVFRATESRKVERDGAVCGVEISGVVDGANVREYLARYRDRETGKMGFAGFRVSQVLTAFRLRRHGEPVEPTKLLSIREGATAPVRLKVHAYGKCKACGTADAAMADKATCKCGGAIERRTRNEVDRWLEPDEATKPDAKTAKPAAAGEAADQWG